MRAATVFACVLVAGSCSRQVKTGSSSVIHRSLIAEAEGLDGDAWRAADSEGDRAYRSIAEGREAVLPIPAWWGKALRPERGECYRALVEYKDTANSPIRVQVFAGLPGRYEIHRIGGLADGQWKTAVVPLPWDMVCRVPGSDRTELILYAPPGADVPVRSVCIERADAAQDEARWAEETRAWVARVQADARANATGPDTQEAILTADIAMKRLVPFVRSTARLIQCTSAPQDGETGAPLRVRMAVNEIQPAQLGVYANGAPLGSLTVQLAPNGLVDAEGVGLDATVELFAAEYSVVSAGHLFPQRFWPAYPVDIPSGRSHLFWLTVTTQKERSRPGTYTAELVFKAEGVPEERLRFEVEVMPITLLTMKEAGLHMGSCVTGLLPAHELEFLVRHNQNSINLWYYGFQPGILKRSETEFDLDFTICDEFMRGASAAGLENFVYFLGGDPYGFPDTAHLERELYRRVAYSGDDMMAGRIELLRKTGEALDRLTPKLRPLYVAWTKQFMSHAQEAGWPEPILTPFDEPAKWVQGHWAAAKLYYWKDPKTLGDNLRSVKVRELEKFLAERRAEGVEPDYVCDGGAGEWIKGHFKDSCAAIHEGWPKTRVYGSIHHAEPGIVFLDDIEVFCTNAIHEDNALGDKVRAAGPNKTFWQYSGTGDSTEPAAGRYAFGFFFAAFDSRGSLCWAYNWGDRFDTRSGSQWVYAWTTPYSVVRAPFFEGVREAWDDRRYVETLKSVATARGRTEEAASLLEEIFDAAVKTRTEGGTDTVHDFWARTKDPDALDTMRQRIAAMIMELDRKE